MGVVLMAESRIEQYLNYLINESGELPDKPKSRIEALLLELCQKEPGVDITPEEDQETWDEYFN